MRKLCCVKLAIHTRVHAFHECTFGVVGVVLELFGCSTAPQAFLVCVHLNRPVLSFDVALGYLVVVDVYLRYLIGLLDLLDIDAV